MPGMTATLGLDASGYEARLKAILALNKDAQLQMASYAEVESARHIQAIESEMAAATAGSEAWGVLAAERAKVMAQFTVAVDRNVNAQIAAEARANEAATKAAEKKEKLAVRGQMSAEAAADAEVAARAKATEEQIALEAKAAAAATHDAEQRELLALRGQRAVEAAARKEAEARVKAAEVERAAKEAQYSDEWNAMLRAKEAEAKQLERSHAAIEKRMAKVRDEEAKATAVVKAEAAARIKAIEEEEAAREDAKNRLLAGAAIPNSDFEAAKRAGPLPLALHLEKQANENVALAMAQELAAETALEQAEANQAVAHAATVAALAEKEKLEADITSGATERLAAEAAVEKGVADYNAAATAVISAEANLADAQSNSIVAETAQAAAAAEVEKAAATVRATAAAEAEAATAKTTQKVFSSLITILRDISRGQWTRAAGATSTLLQGLGISAGMVIAAFALLGTAIYAVGSTIRGLSLAAEEAAASMFKIETHMHSQIEVTRSLREEYRRLREEMERKNDEENETTITKAAEDRVAALHKQFELQQKMAKLAGQTPQESARKTQEQAKKEAEIYKAAEAEAKTKLDAAKKKEADSLSQASQKKMHDAEVALEDAKKLAKKREDELGEALTGKTGSFLPEGLYGQGFHPILALQNAGNKDDATSALVKLAFPLANFMPKGDVLVETKTGGLTTKKEKQQLSDVAEGELAVAEIKADALKKDRADAKNAKDKAQRDYEQAKEKAARSAEAAEAVGDVDTNVAKAEKSHEKREGNLTELQRHGAYIGPEVQLVDINRNILQHVRNIDRRQSTASTQRGAFPAGGWDGSGPLGGFN